MRSTSVSKTLVGASLALLVSAGAVQALPVAGSVVVTDLGPSTNSLSFPTATGTFNFSNLLLNTPTTVAHLFTIYTTDTNLNSTATDNIQAVFTFTAPPGGGPGVDPGTDTAYLSLTHNPYGQILWSDPIYVNFPSGVLIKIDLSNATFYPSSGGGDSVTTLGSGCSGGGEDSVVALDGSSSRGCNMAAQIDATFTATAVPEPTSLFVLGIGLAGLGAATRRRRSAV